MHLITPIKSPVWPLWLIPCLLPLIQAPCPLLSSSPSPFVHSLHACLRVLNKMNLSDLQRGLRSWQITGGPLTLALHFYFYFFGHFPFSKEMSAVFFFFFPHVFFFFSRCLKVSDDKMSIHLFIPICDICIHLTFHIYYFPAAPSWPV